MPLFLKPNKMKKIPNINKLIRLSPIKMYWDDLQEIEERIQNGRIIEIESGKYKYESLEELRLETKKSYINRVKITGLDKEKYHNRISVDIDPSGVWIYQDSESTETAAKVKELIKSNSPWYMYSPLSPSWYVITAMFGWAPIWIMSFISFQIENIYLDIIMILIGVATGFWAIKNEPILGSSKIFTSLKKDKINFWERNKDELLRESLIVIITSFVSFLIGYFIKK